MNTRCIDLRVHPEAGRELFVGRILQYLAAADHYRDVIDAQVETFDERLDIRVTVDIHIDVGE